jgi:hypothetical protein
MKKILLLFVLLVISTTSYAGTGGKEYSHWGNLNDGGTKSIVPYPKGVGKIRYHKVNPSSYGKYLGFSVFLKTTNVIDSVYPYIFLQDKAKKDINSTRGTKITGTTSWKRYYTPHIYVPLHTEWVLVGVRIKGAGKVEYYDYQLKEYSYK